MIARRGLLKLGLGAAVSAGTASVSSLAWALPGEAARKLTLRHTHTGETFSAVYYENGAYVREAVSGMSRLLRDYRSGQVHQIDPRLLDTLSAVARRTDAQATFDIICGYRSPQTNARMRAHSGEVAKKSLHMEGQAVDIRLADVDLQHVFAAARSLEQGGVGYYPGSRFVHVDVGPVRTWRGV